MRLNTVIFVRQDCTWTNPYILKVGSPETIVYNSPGVSCYNEWEGTWVTDYVKIERNSPGKLDLGKLIYLSDCLADENSMIVTAWYPTDYGDSLSASGLAYYNECLNVPIALTDLTFEVYDKTSV